MTLYLRLAAYALAAALIFGGGWHMGGLAPVKALADLKAQDWQGKAQANAAALAATQLQLKTLQDTVDRNAGIIQGLNNENLKTAAERDHNADLYRRLFNNPSGPTTARGGSVPEATGASSAAGAGGAGGGGAAAGLLADASAECKRNADRLDAASAEVIPQVQLVP